MQPDISNLSISELESLTLNAQALIETKKEQHIDEAYTRIIQIAEEVGLSLDELISRAKSAPKSSTRKPVAPRYKNPDNMNETWTGRGKQPRWLAAKVAAGASLEDFLI